MYNFIDLAEIASITSITLAVSITAESASSGLAGMADKCSAACQVETPGILNRNMVVIKEFSLLGVVEIHLVAMFTCAKLDNPTQLQSC